LSGIETRPMSEKSRAIPFFSFELAPQELKTEWNETVAKCISKGVFILGDEVKILEEDWARLNGAKFALGVSNGQDALILALRALGIKAGDKVIVPAHSFIATHNAILEVGAIPYSIDVDENGLIDLSIIQKLDFIPSALIVVHMHGMICDMDAILQWASDKNVPIIEDCSQAHFAGKGTARAGSFGDVGIFSCYPTKNLGALGDAGLIITNSETIFKKMKSLSNYGSTPGNKYEHKSFGLNNRLDEIQAGILNVNLKYLENWNNRRREIADLYFQNLNHPSIEFLQPNLEGNVWHHFCILYEKRDELRKRLVEKAVYTEIHYPNVAGIECENYANLREGNYPIATRIAQTTLSLPISPWHSDEDILQVTGIINQTLLEI
jgi:dTDP-4-amino-4,6-dideoxygalactose transaminase